MRTVQELIALARSLDPERLASDPEGAIRDAHVVSEAIRQASLQAAVPVEPEVPAANNGSALLHFPVDRRRARSADTVKRLAHYLDTTSASKTSVAKALKVSHGSMHAWLTGRWLPGPKMTKAIKVFLEEKEASLK